MNIAGMILVIAGLYGTSKGGGWLTAFLAIVGCGMLVA